MTAHELLNFLDRQKKFCEQTFPERRGIQAWPTRQETVFNLNLNRQWFPNDPRLSTNFARAFNECRKNGLIEQRACTATCHARHIIITNKGKAQLAIWKVHGCRSCEDHADRLDRVVMSKEEVA